MRQLLTASLVLASVLSGCATTQTGSSEAVAAQKRAFALWLAAKPPTDYPEYTPVHIETPQPIPPITTGTPSHCTTRAVLNSLQTDCY